MGRLFGTDGIRGVAVTELTCELAMNIGRAAAAVLAKGEPVNDPPSILIGKDTRKSSDILEAALIAGITSAGADAGLLGVIPTPGVAYCVKRYEADAGIMISASHNPAEFNGIKIFGKDGFKLSDAAEDEIAALALNPAEITLKDGSGVGAIRSLRSAVVDYNFDLQKVADRTFEGLKVMVDCANGCAGVCAGEILANMGADIMLINNSPDGLNINLDCGSTHMEELCKSVVENKFDLGLAFDGDADRLLAVDEKGQVVDGDKLIAILSLYMKQKGRLPKDTAVVTVMSNMGFHQYMRNNAVSTVTVKVGDKYVLEKMLAEGFAVGGEQSGHIIFLDHATTGDGMITALKLLSMLADRRVPLSTLASPIPVFPQVLKNIAISPAKKGTWETNPAIKAVCDEVKLAAGNNARLLIRESGTEPLFRVMIEGKNPAEIQGWADKICAVAERELG